MPSYGLIDSDYTMRMRATADHVDGPIYMLGLTRLLPGTDTSPRGLPAVGRDSVTDYAPIPLLASVGAALCLAATVVASSPNWDRVGVVGYPSRRAFLELAYQPDFRAWHARKEQSLEHTVVLCTLRTGGLPAADGQRLLLEVWNGPEPAPLVGGPAARFDVEGTVIGDGRQWSGVRYTPLELGTALPLHPAGFGYQALLLAPVRERWR
ncbi:MAG: hypothetical protein ACRDOK_19415 [Streptosporangiaceae bacterium]